MFKKFSPLQNYITFLYDKDEINLQVFYDKQFFFINNVNLYLTTTCIIKVSDRINRSFFCFDITIHVEHRYKATPFKFTDFVQPANAYVFPPRVSPPSRKYYVCVRGLMAIQKTVNVVQTRFSFKLGMIPKVCMLFLIIIIINYICLSF